MKGGIDVFLIIKCHFVFIFTYIRSSIVSNSVHGRQVNQEIEPITIVENNCISRP